jgi:hypothetical protein
MSIRPRAIILSLYALAGILAPSAATAQSTALAAAQSRRVFISELMYHPPGDTEDLEFIELRSTDSEPADVSGWRLARGIEFVFPDDTLIPEGGSIVVSSHPDRVREAYGLESALGPWKGRLRNTSERVDLLDTDDAVVDRCWYDSRGDWPLAADGYGSSLERVDPASPGDLPGAWEPAPLGSDDSKAGGSPGRPNSAADGIAVSFRDLVIETERPGADAPVAITVSIECRAEIESATLHARVFDARGRERPGGERIVPLERSAGDARKGTYRGILPASPAGSIVRFHAEAVPSGGAPRRFPSANDVRPERSYLVEDERRAESIPLLSVVELIETKPSPSESTPSSDGTPRGPASSAGSDSDSDSDDDARPPPRRGFDARRFGFGFGFGRAASGPTPPRGRHAVVCVPVGGARPELYDYVRLSPRPGGHKLRFHADAEWRFHDPFADAVVPLGTANLIFEGSTRFLWSEALAFEVYRRAGVPAPAKGHVRFSLDGRGLGYHLVVEQPNRAFLRRQERNDAGNLYKILWYERGVIGQHEKKTHVGQGHDDITSIVADLRSNDPAADPAEIWKVIESRFNVEEFASYFAASMCLSNWDGFFNNYFVYHDVEGSGLWEIYPWDEDKTWGYYDGIRRGEVFTDMALTYGMAGDPSNGRGQGIFGGRRGWWRPGGWFSAPLLANPEFRKHFLRRLRDLVDHVFTEDEFGPVIDELERRLLPEIKMHAKSVGEDPGSAERNFLDEIDLLRRHLTGRRSFLLEQPELAGVPTREK